MAKFHGFEIKNMKTWEGMEGIGTQGDVWLNGKKLGFWFDDGNGGEARFAFPRAAVADLDRLVADQIPECAITLYNGQTLPADLSCVLSKLADLKDLEKDWKKANKRRSWMVEFTDGDGDNSVFYELRSRTGDGKHDMATIVSIMDTLKEERGWKSVDYRVYDSAECFVIGDALTGAESAIKKCAEWQKERKAIMDAVGEKYA